MLLRVEVDVSGVLRCTTTLYDLLLTGLGVNEGSEVVVGTTSIGGGMGLVAEDGEVAFDAVEEADCDFEELGLWVGHCEFCDTMQE